MLGFSYPGLKIATDGDFSVFIKKDAEFPEQRPAGGLLELLHPDEMLAIFKRFHAIFSSLNFFLSSS